MVDATNVNVLTHYGKTVDPNLWEEPLIYLSCTKSSHEDSWVFDLLE